MSKALYRTGLIAQSLLYVGAGLNHFRSTSMYAAIVPPHYSHPVEWVQITGVAEVLGGVGLLLPQTRRLSAWSIIAMLIVYFDVHFYMLQHVDQFAPIPKWTLEARIPLQFVLIAWAYVYARRRQNSR